MRFETTNFYLQNSHASNHLGSWGLLPFRTGPCLCQMIFSSCCGIDVIPVDTARINYKTVHLEEPDFCLPLKIFLLLFAILFFSCFCNLSSSIIVLYSKINLMHTILQVVVCLYILSVLGRLVSGVTVAYAGMYAIDIIFPLMQLKYFASLALDSLNHDKIFELVTRSKIICMFSHLYYLLSA